MSTNRARGTAIPHWANARPTRSGGGGAGASTATPPRGRGWLGHVSAPQIVALAAAVALLSGGGIAVWQMAAGTVPGVDWPDQAQARLESVNRQIATVNQATLEWQAQPAAVHEQRPDVLVQLAHRAQTLRRERDTLGNGLVAFRSLPTLRAADDASTRQLRDLQQQVHDATDPTTAQRLSKQLRLHQRLHQGDDARLAAANDATTSAQSAARTDDSGQTSSIIDQVHALLAHPTTPAPPRPLELPAPTLLPGTGQNPLPDAGSEASSRPSSSPPTLNAPDPLASGPLPPAPVAQPEEAPRVPRMNTGQPPTGPDHLSALPPGRPTGHATHSVPHKHSNPFTARPDVPLVSPPSPVPGPPAVLAAPEPAQVPSSEQQSGYPPAGEAPVALPPVPGDGAQSEQSVPTKLPAPSVSQPILLTPAAGAQPGMPAPEQEQPAQVEPRQSGPEQTAPTQRTHGSSGTLTAEQVRRATGSRWVARESQTPEGQAIMRQLFGDDHDFDGSDSGGTDGHSHSTDSDGSGSTDDDSSDYGDSSSRNSASDQNSGTDVDGSTGARDQRDDSDRSSSSGDTGSGNDGDSTW